MMLKVVSNLNYFMILWFYEWGVFKTPNSKHQIQNTKYAAEKDAKNQDTVAG